MTDTFASRLRKEREAKKLTQQKMAEQLHLTAVAYGAWERGENEPSIRNLVNICNILGVTSDWLIGLDKVNAAAKAPMIGRIAALKDEADQAAATLSRLVGQLHDLEKSV